MKKQLKLFFFWILFFLLIQNNFYAFSKNRESKPMNVKTFSFKLIKELGLSYKIHKPPTFQRILTILPDSISEKLRLYKPSEYVSRKLLVEVLTPYLNSSDALKVLYGGDLKKTVITSEIMAIFAKCKYQNNTSKDNLNHSFDKKLDRQLSDVPNLYDTNSINKLIKGNNPESANVNKKEKLLEDNTEISTSGE